MSSIEIRQRELWDRVNWLKEAHGTGQIELKSLQAEATQILDQIEEFKASILEDCSQYLRLIRSLYFILYPLPSDAFGTGTDCVDLRIRCEVLTVAYTPMNSTQYRVGGWLSQIGRSYKTRFEISRDVNDLSLSAEYQRQSICLAASDHPDMAAQFNSLGCKYITLFEYLGNIEDANKAIHFLEKAVSLTLRDNSDMPNRLDNLGLAYCSRFEALGRADDINKAIELQEQVVSTEDVEENPDGPSWFSNLANSYLSRFEAIGDQEDLDRAMNYHKKALSLTPAGGDKIVLSSRLNNIGNSCMARFEHLGLQEDLNRAVEYQTQSVSLLPEDYPKLAMYLSNLSASHLTRFQHMGGLVDIEKALELQLRSLSILDTLKGHRDLAGTLSNLGNCYASRFERLGLIQDIEDAIKYQTKAVELSEESDPSTPVWLSGLGSSHSSRFNSLGDMKDLQKAIDCAQKALALTPEGHPQMAHRFTNLGNRYISRFDRLGEIDDVNKAIELQSKAMSLLSVGHEDFLAGLNSLGGSYKIRFERRNNLEDIRRAIECHSQVVSLTPKDHPYRSIHLNSLGVSYSTRFEYLGNQQDIEQAITHQSEAIQCAADNHPLLSEWLSNLSASYIARFQHRREPRDLDQAIENQSRAVSLTPRDHANMHTIVMHLGTWYSLRFSDLGYLKDIDRAIDLQLQAVSLTPKGHPSILKWLSNLGMSYAVRFTRLTETKDIDLAIEHQIQAVTLLSEEDAALPGRLNNLCCSYLRRFSALGALEDLDNAIKHQERALSFTPDPHADMHGIISNLATAYLRRSKATTNLSDVNQAIELYLRAVSIAPENHAYKLRSINSLGRSFCHRFTVTGQLKDIDKAIEYHLHVLSNSPKSDMDSPVLLRDLGNAYKHRFRSLDDLVSLNNALECFRKSAQSRVADPMPKFLAACDWIDLSSRYASSELLEACQVAMDLVPEIVWIGSTIIQRYSYVHRIGNIARRATASAIQASRYELALEWLEQGQSIVWNQVLRLRNPLDELRSVHPMLADQLAQVSKNLHDAGSFITEITDYPHTTEQAAQKRRRLAEEYEKIMAEVRQTSGFENFLRPKKFFELLPAARKGPVAVINIERSRCDALVIKPGSTEISLVPLPDISYDQTVELRRKTEQSLEEMCLRERSSYRRPVMSDPEENLQNQELQLVLSTIWMCVAKPVLDSLEYRPTLSMDTIPHITWCTTGPLSSLPIHAAGNYDKAGAKIFECVVSSYTPTLSAIISESESGPCATSSILGIAQENTPGQNPLPGTINELALIAGHVEAPISYSQLTGSSATTLATLDAMEQYNWVHLACHANQNSIEPTESGFFLHDGTLSLARIVQRQFKGKGLAFLSACQTATGDRLLADESIHLASGMLMAGYPSIIATSWSIVDSDAPLIADVVYKILLKEGMMNHKDAAKALHVAVQKLRDIVGEKAFWRWAPYIHIGT